jgi:hypothetical protein
LSVGVTTLKGADVLALLRETDDENYTKWICAHQQLCLNSGIE